MFHSPVNCGTYFCFRVSSGIRDVRRLHVMIMGSTKQMGFGLPNSCNLTRGALSLKRGWKSANIVVGLASTHEG